MSYSLLGFRAMVDDSVRMQAYATALQQSIRPGMSVLDIGAGTGIMSLLACRFNASRVVAVEPNRAILIAQANARLNGMEGTIEFFRGLTTNFNTADRFDIIVADLRGVLPTYTTHFQTIRHARDSFLKPGGTLIPGGDVLWAAVAESPSENSPGQPWNPSSFGLDLSADECYLRNTPRKARNAPESLLSEAKSWLEIDYMKFDSDDCRGTYHADCTRSGIARGIVVWFESHLIRGVTMSNAPSEPAAIYGSLYFPLSKDVRVDESCCFNVDFWAKYKNGEYEWNWRTQILDKSTGKVHEDLQQSEFLSCPLDRDEMKKLEVTYIPKSNADCQLDRFIMQQFDGNKTNREIAEAVQAKFADRFASWDSALTCVCRLASIYAQ